jgi:hypothetical protein
VNRDQHENLKKKLCTKVASPNDAGKDGILKECDCEYMYIRRCLQCVTRRVLSMLVSLDSELMNDFNKNITARPLNVSFKVFTKLTLCAHSILK